MKFPIACKGILKATDPTSSRFALGGVFVERDGKNRLTATCTDGRRLLTVEWKDGDDRYCRQTTATLIAEKDVLKAAKSADKRETEILIDELPVGSTDVAVNLKTNATTISTNVIEGPFPKWQSVMPTKMDVVVPRKGNEDYAKVTLDYRFLRDLADAVKELATDELYGVNLYVPLDGDRAVVAVFQGETVRLKGLIMPLGKDLANDTVVKVESVASTTETLEEPAQVMPPAKKVKPAKTKKAAKPVAEPVAAPEQPALKREDFADFNDVIESLLADGYDLHTILQSLAEELAASA